MCFDKNMHAAHWVAYPLHSSYRGGSGRTEAWAADPLIEEQYQPKLYGTDGLTFYRNYSRGHQIPSADRTANDELNNQTFYASNMTPQSGDFNGGIWGTLEGKIRDNICNDTLYVVTGCYFGNNYTTTRDGCNGNNESQISKDCPVPTHYFKVILRTRSGSSGKPIPECSANELKAIGFKVCLVSNNKEPRVATFNKKMKVNYIYKAGKPSKKGYMRAMDEIGCTVENTLAVGDQIYTDIIGSASLGIHTILVKPIDTSHEEIQITLKRIIEKPFIAYFKKKHGIVR